MTTVTDTKLHQEKICGYCKKMFNNGAYPRKKYCSTECNHDSYIQRKFGRKPIRRDRINDLADTLFSRKSLTEDTLSKLFNNKDLGEIRQSRIIPNFPVLFFLFFTAFNLSLCQSAYPAQIQTASWYSKASCIKEGTSGVLTASGQVFDENALTAASWFYPFGTHVKVINLKSYKSVEVVITDRGPANRLVKKGRVIDLSRTAFQAISPLSAGVIPVHIERMP